MIVGLWSIHFANGFITVTILIQTWVNKQYLFQSHDRSIKSNRRSITQLLSCEKKVRSTRDDRITLSARTLTPTLSLQERREPGLVQAAAQRCRQIQKLRYDFISINILISKICGTHTQSRTRHQTSVRSQYCNCIVCWEVIKGLGTGIAEKYFVCDPYPIT